MVECVMEALREKWPSLLNHLVGAGEQRRRHFDAKRLGSFEIDHEFELRRQRHRRSVGAFLTFR
jgi:hypothetical protein